MEKEQNKKGLKFGDFVLAVILLFLSSGWVLWFIDKSNNSEVQRVTTVYNADTSLVTGLIDELNEVYKYNARLRDTIKTLRMEQKIFRELSAEQGVVFHKKNNTYWVEMVRTDSDTIARR